MALGLGGFGSALAVAADTLGIKTPFGETDVPGSSFEISVEGKTTIVLKGRAMPFPEVAFPTEMRTKKTVYPGNPSATIQLLSYDSLNTSLKGEWNYRFLKDSVSLNGDSGAIVTPAQLCQLFEEVVRGGRPVRVQWLYVVRAGYLKKFTPTWLRANDVQWEMEFEWMQAADIKATSPRGLPTAGFGPNDLLKTLNKIEDIAALAPMLARSLSASIVDNIATLREHVSKLIQTFGAIEALVNLPAAVYGAIKAAIASLRDEGLELIRRIAGTRSSARSPEVVGVGSAALAQDPIRPSGTTGNSSVVSSGGQMALLEAWERSLGAAVAELIQIAIMVGVQTDTRVRPEPSKVVTVREGETLYAIAAREYGSAEYATYLMQANRLQGLKPPAGIRLAVPARPYGAATDVEITGTEVITLTGDPTPCAV